MLNAENKDYKVTSLEALTKNVKLSVLCHDCNCNTGFGNGVFCKHAFLDAWHAHKHKCDKRKFDPQHENNSRKMSGLKSEGCEQLWSKTDKLAPFVMKYKKVNYRLFLKRMCVWRNAYTRSKLTSDINPARSMKARSRNIRRKGMKRRSGR